MTIILHYLLFGAAAALGLMVLAKVIMAKLMQREEDYYEKRGPVKMVESAYFGSDDAEESLLDPPAKSDSMKGGRP